jgi:isopenicillin-N epimerase
MDSNPCAWFTDVPRKVAVARHQIAEYLKSEPEATALVPNASAGASVVFNSVAAWRGMEIVTTDHTYGAVLMGARRLAQRWQGSVTSVHVPLSADENEAFELVTGALTDNTALVVVDHVTSATAMVLPAGRIAAEGRRRGIPVMVDGAHTPGLLAEPLQGVAPDFWIGNLHKFACAPRGTAAIVAADPHAQLLSPPIDSWGALLPYPERFDHQGTNDFTAPLAAPVAFQVIEERYGWDCVRTYARGLASYAESIVAAALTEATGQDASVTVGAPADALRLVGLPEGLATTPDDARDLRQLIAARLGVETAITSWNGRGFLRLSSHVYNTPDDYEQFVDRAVPFIAEQARTLIETPCVPSL